MTTTPAVRVDIEQRTAAWRSIRRAHVCASDMPSLLNESGRRGPNQVWHDAMKPLPDEEDAEPAFILREGLRVEEPVLQQACLALDLPFLPANYRRTINDIPFWCSLDGVCDVGGQRIGIEIKLATAKDHGAVQTAGLIPLKYRAQLQHQILCAELDTHWYGSYHKATMDLQLVPVVADPVYQRRILEVAVPYYAALQSGTEFWNPLTPTPKG